MVSSGRHRRPGDRGPDDDALPRRPPLATRPRRLIASRARAAGAALGLAARRGLDGDPNLQATGAGTRIKFLAVALEIWRVGDLKA